ncbi:unnamed protein product [Camellia sinensis]
MFDYTEEKYMREAYNMKDEVKGLINGVMDPLAKLELIDAVQRLGLKYHFEGEIKQSLDDLIHLHNDAWCSDDLHATALRFRLLRQHGCDVPKDVFESFKDETGNFKISLFEDVKGLLSLYEASFFGLDGETIIDEAKIFTIANLKNIKGDMSPSMVRKVGHALDMPLHWRLTRVEARWFIETYEQEQNIWDVNGIDKLPHNIRTCLLALFNTVNEIGYWTLKNRGFNIIPYLSKA